MRLELGYPDHDAERLLLKGQDRHSLIESLPVKLPPEQLLKMQHAVIGFMYPTQYWIIARPSFALRANRLSISTLVTEAGLALLNAAKAWAFMDQRDAVIPEDIQAVLAAVAGHRLRSGNNDSAQ